MPEHASVAMALWAVSTHTLAAAKHAPILLVTSPEPGCGKSMAREVLGTFVRKPLATANVSPAVLFRVAEELAPTLLIDEGDTFMQNYDELRGIINSGFTRGEVAIRCVGDKQELRTFRTFGAKLLAQIGDPHATLLSRSIRIAMRRATVKDHLEDWDADDQPADRQARIARWAKDNLDALKGAQQGPGGGSDQPAS